MLVDFWTYSCVNWLRTVPYLSAWEERYRDLGFVLVGAHFLDACVRAYVFTFG